MHSNSSSFRLGTLAVTYLIIFLTLIVSSSPVSASPNANGSENSLNFPPGCTVIGGNYTEAGDRKCLEDGITGQRFCYVAKVNCCGNGRLDGDLFDIGNGNELVSAAESCEPGDPGCRADCTKCGDAKVQTDNGESCDKGDGRNGLPGSNCLANCTVPVCGNGVYEPENASPNEQCDGDDFRAQDQSKIAKTCDQNCQLHYCGDGITDAGEQCDDGNNINEDACTNECRTPVCGNDLLQTGEECDGNLFRDADISKFGKQCTDTCELTYCGDGQRDTGEQCDDGNTVNNDACTNECQTPVCGNGLQQTGEQCDDGNTINDDGCSNACTIPRCGDGILQAGEQCDDGNTINNDACKNNCEVARCGDGILSTVSGEQCDDGNNIDGDGCTATCTSCPLPTLDLSLSSTAGTLSSIPVAVTYNRVAACGLTTSTTSFRQPARFELTNPIPISVSTNDPANLSLSLGNTNGDFILNSNGGYSIAGAGPLQHTGFTSRNSSSFQQCHGWYYYTYRTYTYSRQVSVQATVSNSCGSISRSVPITFNGSFGYHFKTHHSGASPVAINLGARSASEIAPVISDFKLSAEQKKPVLWYGSAETPLLVQDLNQNGAIDDGKELAGTWSEGKKWRSGFEFLSTKDTNRDGFVNAEELKGFSLWFDHDSNGKTDPGELTELGSIGFEKLNLSYDQEKQLELYGINLMISTKGATLKTEDETKSVEVFDWFVNSEASWQNTVNKVSASGAKLFTARETPKWEENKNDFDYYLSLSFGKKVTGKIYSAIQFESIPGVREHALFSGNVSGKLDGETLTLEFSLPRGPESINNYHAVLTASSDGGYSGKLEAKTMLNGRLVETFSRTLTLSTNVKEPSFAAP
jgi:cysteine-rich repeat protein